ncbi:MAG: RDD family protein [Pseudomonadota bacterium]
MQNTMTDPDASWALPAPETHPEFYADTVTKRAVAWAIDVVLIGLLTGLFAALTVGLAVLLLPLFGLVSFLYRWWSLAARSATPGMRLASIELRLQDGASFDTGTAFLHTMGYFISMAIFPLQLISVILMLMSARGQGLTDHILGTAAINRTARA